MQRGNKAHMSHLLFLDDKVPDFPIPARERRCECIVELACARTVCCAPADLKIYKEFPDTSFPFGENFPAIDLAKFFFNVRGNMLSRR